MCVYLRTEFQVSRIILTSFRQGVILTPSHPPSMQNEPLKSPPRLGLIYTQGLRYYPFAVDLERCVGRCNTLNNLSNKSICSKLNKRFKFTCF